MMNNAFFVCSLLAAMFVGVVIMGIICSVIECVEKRDQIRKQIKEHRDAFIEDLIKRSFLDQTGLNEDLMEALKFLIHLSFKAQNEQNKEQVKENEQNKPDKEPAAAQPPGKQQQK